jgi:hypothetical protein
MISQLAGLYRSPGPKQKYHSVKVSLLESADTITTTITAVNYLLKAVFITQV